jgi:hypothetical protein
VPTEQVVALCRAGVLVVLIFSVAGVLAWALWLDRPHYPADREKEDDA